MQVEKIYYRLKADLGDGLKEEITLVVATTEEETVAECVEALRILAERAKLPNKWDILTQIRNDRRLSSN